MNLSTKIDRWVISASLSAYLLIAPFSNLVRHYIDYERYASMAECAKSIEENKFWDGVSGLVKERMKSNDIFIPASYEIKRVKARFINENVRPIPNTIEKYMV